MAINQTVTINASAQKVYDTLTSAEAFSQATDAPADIAQGEGGGFSCFGGQVTGRHIELQPSRRIVQAWRVGPWPEGVYSIVKFELDQSGGSTKITLDHAGFPADSAEHLAAGWHKMYWDPLKAYLE